MVNFILSFIPQQYLIIVGVFLFLLLVCIFYVLSRFIKWYILLCILITVGTILFADYRIGKIIKDCQYNMKSVTEQLMELDNKSNQITEKIVVQYKDRIKYITKKEIQIKNEIKEKITEQDDKDCKIPDAFIELHNKAARIK